MLFGMYFQLLPHGNRENRGQERMKKFMLGWQDFGFALVLRPSLQQRHSRLMRRRSQSLIQRHQRQSHPATSRRLADVAAQSEPQSSTDFLHSP
jgi:hypothetical protein